MADFPTGEGGLSRVLGEAAIPVGMFQVSKGEGAAGRAFRHGLAADGPQRHAQPARARGQARGSRWSRSTCMVLPDLDPKTNGRFGQIDVLAGPDRSLYYRVFGRGKEARPSCAPPDRSRRGRRSTPSAAGPGCP